MVELDSQRRMLEASVRDAMSSRRGGITPRLVVKAAQHGAPRVDHLSFGEPREAAVVPVIVARAAALRHRYADDARRPGPRPAEPRGRVIGRRGRIDVDAPGAQDLLRLGQRGRNRLDRRRFWPSTRDWERESGHAVWCFPRRPDWTSPYWPCWARPLCACPASPPRNIPASV